MELTKAGPGTDAAAGVPRAFWRHTMVTGLVLGACLVVIALLAGL